VRTRAWTTYQDAVGNVIFGGRGLGPVPASKPLGSPRCVFRRSYGFRLRHGRGVRVVRVDVFVNGKRWLTRRSRDVKRVTVARSSGQKFTVRIVMRLSNGKRRTSTHRYKAC
jgi:hypothetical protein